ncbi:MAG TPA: CopG family transcriptional regulator [Ruminococcus sp.]|nr:CopG family transcriptional regulator [Ruminococcus sp.]HBD71694.1 CopG family transcriptional regulator [Ruminococcus sp.]HCW13368.1 CopG family transcriptional regulator [Ruminococcus sp.]
MSPRTGRPKIDNPKSISLKIRIDADTHRALLQYCKDNKLTKAAAVRQGIALILGKKK